MAPDGFHLAADWWSLSRVWMGSVFWRWIRLNNFFFGFTIDRFRASLPCCCRSWTLSLSLSLILFVNSEPIRSVKRFRRRRRRRIHSASNGGRSRIFKVNENSQSAVGKWDRSGFLFLFAPSKRASVSQSLDQDRFFVIDSPKQPKSKENLKRIIRGSIENDRQFELFDFSL